jgi:hypothetical protein
VDWRAVDTAADIQHDARQVSTSLEHPCPHCGTLCGRWPLPPAMTAMAWLWRRETAAAVMAAGRGCGKVKLLSVGRIWGRLRGHDELRGCGKVKLLSVGMGGDKLRGCGKPKSLSVRKGCDKLKPQALAVTPVSPSWFFGSQRS